VICAFVFDLDGTLSAVVRGLIGDRGNPLRKRSEAPTTLEP